MNTDIPKQSEITHRARIIPILEDIVMVSGCRSDLFGRPERVKEETVLLWNDVRRRFLKPTIQHVRKEIELSTNQITACETCDVSLTLSM